MRVEAVTIAEAAPSTPPTTADTRQEYGVLADSRESAKLLTRLRAT
jgi:hypothetical protein